MTSELKYFMIKLGDIEKQLGANHNASKAKLGRSKDEFKNGEFKVLETIKDIQKMQHELDEKANTRNNIETIKLNTEIRSKIAGFKGQVNELERILMKQRMNKKHQPDEIEAKDKRLKNYKTHLTIFENHAKGDFATLLDEPEPMTLEQLKLQIANEGDYRTKDDELTPEEIASLDKFAKKDKELDVLAGEVDDRLGDLLIKVNNMGEGIDSTTAKIHQNIYEVDKSKKQLETTNKKLKELVKKYRSPNKFCLDIICILLLLGLGAVLYNMIKK